MGVFGRHRRGSGDPWELARGTRGLRVYPATDRLPTSRWGCLRGSLEGYRSQVGALEPSPIAVPLIRIATIKVCSTTSPLDWLPRPVTPEPPPLPPPHF